MFLVIIFAVSINQSYCDKQFNGFLLLLFFLGNSASAKPTLQRYPLRSSNKLKEQKPDASDSINRSQSKRYFLVIFFVQLSLIFFRIRETSHFLRKLDLILLGSFEFVQIKIEELNLETLNFYLSKFG
jgi:zona occludens toxin (predicted ATPase)